MNKTDEFKAITLRQRIWEKWFYLKLFYNRSQSYTSLPLDFIVRFGVITMWIKLYTGFNNNLVLAAGAVLFFIVMTGVGYLDVRRGIIREETSFNNRYNPEIQYIREKVK